MWKAYNEYTAEVYGTFQTQEEAESVAFDIEDELRMEHLPYSDSVRVQEIK